MPERERVSRGERDAYHARLLSFVPCVPHTTSTVPGISVVSTDMTVLMAKYENRGKDIVVFADRSRCTKDLDTGEYTPKREDALKSIALSDECCLACAGCVPFSQVLYCRVADREDWLERIVADDSFDPPREIESLPERIGLGFSDAEQLITEVIPEVVVGVMSPLHECYTEKDVLGDVTILLAGKKGGRPIILKWSQETDWKSVVSPNTRDKQGELSWPRQFGDEARKRFSREIQRQGPAAPVRIRTAMKYAATLGIHATESFTYRVMSQRFRLEEVVPAPKS